MRSVKSVAILLVRWALPLYKIWYLLFKRYGYTATLDRGKLTTIRSCGIWNVIGSDVTIESTFIKYGKSLGGLISITLQQRSVKKWAYSLHVFTHLLHDLDEIRHGKQKKVRLHIRG